MRSGRKADDEYLLEIEAKAHIVADRAFDEGWLTYLAGEDDGQTPLQRSINDLARSLRSTHFEGDGCLGHSGDQAPDSSTRDANPS